MPEKEHIFNADRIYDIGLKIKGIEYGNDLSTVRIISSLLASYQTVIIDLFVDPKDILIGGVHGQDHIELIIQLIETDTQLSNRVELELMFVKNSLEVPISAMMATGVQKDRSHIQFVTIVRPAFKIMTTLVNKVYGIRNSMKSVREISEDLILECGGTPVYDREGENSEKIDQVIIPPVTLIKALKYLDSWFGSHDGAPTQFCQYDGSVHVINLSKRIKKAEVFAITQLASGGDNRRIIEECSDGKHFYTYDNIETHHSANAKFGVLGLNMVYVTKPNDSLHYNIKVTTKDICANYGLIDANDEVLVDKIINRSKHNIDHPGYEYSSHFINSMIAKKVSNLSTISLSIERGLPIDELIRVGESVRLDLQTTEHADISGKYILFSSDLKWEKEGGWGTTAKLELIRTNKVSP